MKVRHFGLPPTCLLGRTEGPAPGATTPLSKQAEVVVEGGALLFPRSAQELTQKAKTERATVLLETLRADGGGSFGGKVRGGVDVGASLRSYFRSLDIAQIAASRGADKAVAEFLGSLDVPDDVRPLLSLAVDAHEGPRPLGDVKTWENDVNTNAMWQRFTQGDVNAQRVTDETLRKWFTQWGAGNDLNGYLNYGDGNCKLGAFRFFARAKELGFNVVANNWQGYLAHLPQSEDSARVLHRFARAFHIDPATIQLGGRPLSTWTGSAARAAKAVHGSPLGREAKWEKLTPQQWNQAFAQQDASTLKVNDATVRNIANAGLLANPHNFVYHAQPAMKTGALSLLARGKELGLNVQVDVNQLTNLGQYTPGSVDNAKAITRIARASGLDASNVVLAGRTISDWLGTKAKAGPAPKRGVLGKVTTWENDGNYNQVYAAARAQPLQARAITDATIQKWFGVWGPNKECTAYWNDGDQNSRVTYALWWARGKEIGCPATFNVASLQQFANGLPATQEAANALRRLGAAFGMNVDNALLQGNTAMSTFPRVGGGGAGLALPAHPPLGSARYTPTQLDKLLADAASGTVDEKIFTIDDGTLKKLVEKQPGFQPLQSSSNERNWQIGVLDLAERGLALDVTNAAEVANIIRAVPTRLLDDDVVGKRLAELASRAGLPASSTALGNGAMLSAHATTKPHVERIERALAGTAAAIEPRRAAKLGEAGGLAAAGPLGNNPGPHSLYWNQKAPGIFEITDDAIRAEMMTWGDYNSWLPHWNNDARLISLVARIAELNAPNQNCTAANNTRAWLANPVPEIFGTADALPRVLRAAKAAGVDPATVKVLQGGQPVPLLEHPALAPLMQGSAADVAEREQARADDFAALAPKAGKHAAEREGAALRLLGVTDPEHEIVHNLDELVPAALAGLRDGNLARIDLHGVPAKHRARVLETAFGRDEHPAVIALLSALFFDVDAGDVEQLLLAKGHVPSVAKEMGELAAALAKRTPAEIAFASVGLGKEPPELDSLALRAWLLDGPSAAQLKKKLGDDSTDASAMCEAMLELAAAASTTPAKKAELMGSVQKAVDDELIARDTLLAHLSDDVKQSLDATAVKNATDALDALLAASPAQQAAAKQALSAALGAASWSDDPNVMAGAVLARALDNDLKFVAPLGDVDAQAGGIQGKPWQTRLSQKAATTAVAGLQLPVEGKAGALALPIADDGAGKKNLQQLATRWLAKRPVSVVGADGADAVAAIARATGAQVFDVSVKPDTSVHDLLGADGAVSKAIAQNGVAHLRLEGGQWPEGLGAALLAAVPKGRIVATGPALAGFPAITFAPLDEASVAAHLNAIGVDDERAVATIAGAFLDVRQLARDGGLGELEEGAFPIALLDRIAARVAPGGAGVDEDALSRALVDVLARRVPGETRDAMIDALAARTGKDPRESEAESTLGVDGKVALIGDGRFPVVGTPAEASSLPALTSSEVEELRAAATALELGEPVVADGAIAERVGTLYGAVTGRDVHVHLLHAQSTADDVLAGAGKDVVVVIHDFTSAPAEVQKALWQAAAEGKIRLVAADASGAMSSDGVMLREGAVTDDDRAERMKLRAQELGLPSAVADGLGELAGELRAMVDRQELHPLVDVTSEKDLDSALELVAQLGGAMSTEDAFVAAVSATFPMSTPAEQEKLEASARKVATG